MDSGERDRQDRVAEHLELDCSGLALAQPSRNGQASGSAAERKDALGRGALVSAPDEDARRPELEAAQAANLHHERSLDVPDALGPGLSLFLGHPDEDSLKGVRKHIVVILVLALLGSGSAAASSAPPVEGRAVLVADGETGDILYERDADQRMPMASITKLMTALVTLEHARPRELVTVARQAVAPGGSSIFLSAGERLRVRDLLAAALIQSANDAAFALAAEVGDGSVKRFVEDDERESG